MSATGLTPRTFGGAPHPRKTELPPSLFRHSYSRGGSYGSSLGRSVSVGVGGDHVVHPVNPQERHGLHHAMPPNGAGVVLQDRLDEPGLTQPLESLVVAV